VTSLKEENMSKLGILASIQKSKSPQPAISSRQQTTKKYIGGRVPDNRKSNGELPKIL
jgi:hypothetical protein